MLITYQENKKRLKEYFKQADIEWKKHCDDHIARLQEKKNLAKSRLTGWNDREILRVYIACIDHAIKNYNKLKVDA